MKFLAVHPSPLMYTRVFLRLEPLDLELVADTVRRLGHDVYLIDLQVETHDDFLRVLTAWRPDVIAFSLNYLANVPKWSIWQKPPRTFCRTVLFSSAAIARHLPPANALSIPDAAAQVINP